MRASPTLALVGLAACGGGGAPGGGFEHLPTLGAGPYEKVPVRLVYDLGADLGDPAVLDTDEGLRVWFTRTPSGAGTSEIDTALVTSPDQETNVVMPALAADQGWENGSVKAPSVVTLPDGRLALYYQGGTSIGRAISSDRGITWVKEAGPLLQDAVHPAAIVLDGEVVLYHGRPDGPGVYRQGLADPVLAGVEEPGVTGGWTPAGQLHVGLFYVQPWEGGLAIGYAGSFDGVTFERFGDGEPVLDPLAPDERAPEVHLHPDEGFLFFAERNGTTQVVGLARHP